MTSGLPVSREFVKMEPRSTRAGEIGAGPEAHEDRTSLAVRKH